MTMSYSAAMSHAPGMTAFSDAPSAAQAKRFFAGMDAARKALETAKPDVLVAIAPDHFTNFFVDNMPAVCVGLNERYEGPVEDWIKVEKRKLVGAKDVAKDILWSAFDSGIEPAFSETLQLEHSLMTPLSLLMPKMDIPLVWIMLNCQVPPMLSLRRCYELGRIIRTVADRRSERIGIIGTGGLSHAPGAPELDQIDEAFDREFLSMLERGDTDAILSMPKEKMDRAGFGAWEIRQWVTVMGAVPERKGRVLCYEPVKEWDTGCGVALFQ
jgi:aromatic ring-opening dioxygenase catalytic subunit (LigB family)